MAKLSRIADVQITLNTTAIQQQSFSDLMVVGSHMLSLSRVLVVTGADELLDMGLSEADPLYIAVSDAFSQTPSVNRVFVGRRNVDTAILSITQAVVGTDYTATVSSRDVNGEIVTTAATYTAVTDDTPALIATALAAAIGTSSAVVSGVAAGNQITISPDVAQTPFSVTATGNTAVATGVSSETMTAALAAINGENSQWYGLVITSKEEADVLATADWTEANEKLFGASSDQLTILDGASTTDLGAVLRDRQYFRTHLWYHAEDETESIEAAISSLAFTFWPGSETWANKRLGGITIDTLQEGQSIVANSKNVNTFEPFRNFAITQYGKVAAGEWIDVIRFRDWLVEEIKIRVVSAVVNAPGGKIPYTDDGIQTIVNAIRGALELGIQRGGIAPEELDDQDRVVPSYTVSAPRSANVAFNDKANRVLRDLKFTARLAGAIHTVEIRGTLTYAL